MLVNIPYLIAPLTYGVYVSIISTHAPSTKDGGIRVSPIAPLNQFIAGLRCSL
ncbi:unnamed protein product, partial [Rotaria magnacalcarata]